MGNHPWPQFQNGIRERSISHTIMPQLSKCLNFEAVWGVLTDQMISV